MHVVRALVDVGVTAALLVATGCTWHVRESNLLFPRATGGADLAARHAASPIHAQEFQLQRADALLRWRWQSHFK